jgi:hypothetical protein
LLSVHREISQSTHSILNPLSFEKLALGTLDMMRAVAADDALAQNV